MLPLIILQFMIVPCFQDANMWQDALRVCKDYIPNKLPLLQEEYDREMATESTKCVDYVVLFFC